MSFFTLRAHSIADDYGVDFDASGKPILGIDDFELRWVHANRIELTIKAKPENKIAFEGSLTPVVSFVVMNDRSGEETGQAWMHTVGYDDCEGGTVYFDIEETDEREGSERYGALSKTIEEVDLDIKFRKNSSAECEGVSFDKVVPKDTEVSNDWFAWVSETQIKSVLWLEESQFTQDPGAPNYFARDSESGAGCTDKLLLNPTENTVKLFELDDSFGLSFEVPPPVANAGSCFMRHINDGKPTSNRPWGVAGTPEAPPAGIFPGGPGASPDCESEGGFISFILCPFLEFANDGISWLDQKIINMLEVNQAYYADDSGIKQAWASIRNIAYILLIPVFLIMVIGTALGFGFLDAYTVKKALPRLLVAVIFMALSFDLAKLLIEVVSGIGKGIGGVIASPFGGLDVLTLPNIFSAPDGVAGNALWGGILLGVGIYALSAVSVGIIGSFLGVAFLALLVVFTLLVLREMLILFLMIMAPIAIISWIFPGNDKLWKIWWNSFSKLLYLFPIIVAILITGRAFAYMINDTLTEENAVVLTVIKLIAFVGPFFFIPKAFQMAGSAFSALAGMANDRSKGIFDRQKKYRQHDGKQNRERRVGRKVLQKRADWQNRLQNQASRGGAFRRRTLGGLSGLVGGYNIQADDAARRAAIGKEVNEQIATGRDDEIRGLTVNKKTSAYRDNYEGNGIRQYRTLGGAWVSEAAVDAGHKRWGNDTYAQQAALSYEMRKASTSEEVDHIRDNYNNVAKSWRMNDNQARGAWIGAGFENQNQHLEFKNAEMSSIGTSGGQGRVGINGAKLATEAYERKGSYQLSQMSGHTIDELHTAYEAAEVAGDQVTMDKIASVSETFVQRGFAGGQQLGLDGTTPIQTQGAQGEAISSAQTYGSGAGSVNEKINNLARRTGRLQAPPSNPHPGPDSPQKAGPTPPPPGLWTP